jgi:hypothetical protein
MLLMKLSITYQKKDFLVELSFSKRFIESKYNRNNNPEFDYCKDIANGIQIVKIFFLLLIMEWSSSQLTYS